MRGQENTRSLFLRLEAIPPSATGWQFPNLGPNFFFFLCESDLDPNLKGEKIKGEQKRKEKFGRLSLSCGGIYRKKA